jgi:hypothetical protein
MIWLDDPAYFASGNALNKALPLEYQVCGPYRVLSDRMLPETYINYQVLTAFMGHLFQASSRQKP